MKKYLFSKLNLDLITISILTLVVIPLNLSRSSKVAYNFELIFSLLLTAFLISLILIIFSFLVIKIFSRFNVSSLYSFLVGFLLVWIFLTGNFFPVSGLPGPFLNLDLSLKLRYMILLKIILFFLIYLFNLVKSRIETKKSSKSIVRFIDSKKIISIVLIPVMLVLFVLGIYNWYSIGMSSNFASSFYYVNEVFYTTFFSILIIADVFILLLSFLYTERYSQIMRNTGFIICTILIRLSFSSTGLTNLLLIVSSVIFGLLILKIYSLMNKIE